LADLGYAVDLKPPAQSLAPPPAGLVSF
jgi:hypothetical protein